MNTLQYTQAEFAVILHKIIRKQAQNLAKELTAIKGQPSLAQVVQYQRQTIDLATLMNDLSLVSSYSEEITYYITWEITINYKQIPKITLAVHPVTKSDYFPTPLSTTLNHYLVKFLVAKQVIPNPWKIS